MISSQHNLLHTDQHPAVVGVLQRVPTTHEATTIVTPWGTEPRYYVYDQGEVRPAASRSEFVSWFVEPRNRRVATSLILPSGKLLSYEAPGPKRGLRVSTVCRGQPYGFTAGHAPLLFDTTIKLHDRWLDLHWYQATAELAQEEHERLSYRIAYALHALPFFERWLLQVADVRWLWQQILHPLSQDALR